MVDFEKLDKYIEHIENNSCPKNLKFNEFLIEFYELSKAIPLSKYLKTKSKTAKTPKIMNAKKAGEVLLYSEKESEIISYLKRNGYKEIPELNYSAIMVLRKVELFDNWKRIISFFQGKGSIQEINDSLRPKLLPQEIEKLEVNLKKQLKLNDKELNFFLNLYNKIREDKELLKSIKRLANQ